jgi:hypothetical protein
MSLTVIEVASTLVAKVTVWLTMIQCAAMQAPGHEDWTRYTSAEQRCFCKHPCRGKLGQPDIDALHTALCTARVYCLQMSSSVCMPPQW